MTNQPDEVRIEIRIWNKQIIINTIFLNTGEIRQKIRSLEWLAKRVLQDELKTWRREYGEDIRITETRGSR